jgi:hypothetical protein
MPSACWYDKRIASPERHLGLFTTLFPGLGRAIQDMNYLDVGMPMGLGFIAGPGCLYASPNRKV